MSRQFKLKIRSGFTSPKQPSFRQSAIQHSKPPTFLTLTQANKRAPPPQSQRISINDVFDHKMSNTAHLTQRVNNIQISNSKRIEDENSQMNSVKREQVQEPKKHIINQFKYQLSLIDQQKSKQEKQQLRLRQIQQKKEQKQKALLNQQRNLNQGISKLEKSIVKIQSKLSRFGFKIILSYIKNLESLKLIKLFKQHCAVTIQKHFRRYIKQKNYKQFKIFVQRIKPSINSFQQGWKLRRIMKIKPILKIINNIKSKTKEEEQKQARILKRQMSSEIARLMKGTKWLNFKQQVKIQKQITQSKSALLDKTVLKNLPTRESNNHILKPVMKDIQQVQEIVNQKEQFVRSTNAWQDMPIKATNREAQNTFYDQYVPKQILKVQVSKQKKIIKKVQTKSQSKLPLKPKQQQSINLESQQQQQKPIKSIKQKILQKKAKSVSSIIDNDPQQPNTKKPQRSQSKQTISKQKSSKQLLLQKRTKYDPRKAVQQSKIKTLLPTPSLQCISVKLQKPINNQFKQQSLVLQSIKQVPKNINTNKRNILPPEINIKIDNTSSRTHQAKPLRIEPPPKHIGINQIQNVFYSAYSNKITGINQKLKRIDRYLSNTPIPSMRVHSKFISRFNPRYFNALQSQIIESYQK